MYVPLEVALNPARDLLVLRSRMGIGSNEKQELDRQ
jgi:hypothetical protein